MLDEVKQKQLDENLTDLERAFYAALRRFAENSKGIVELPEDSLAFLAELAVQYTRRRIELEEMQRKWLVLHGQKDDDSA